MRDRSTDFLMAAAACLGAACFSGAVSSAAGAGPSTTLTLGRRIVDVNGRSASVFEMRQPNGPPALVLIRDSRFRSINDIGEDTIIHRRGQKPPYVRTGSPAGTSHPSRPGTCMNFLRRPECIVCPHAAVLTDVELIDVLEFNQDPLARTRASLPRSSIGRIGGTHLQRS